MKKILIAVTVVAVFVLSACTVSDTPENRAKETEKYLVAVPPQVMVEEMATNLAENVPPEQRDAFITTIISSFDTKAVEKAMREALIKNFTVAELKYLTDFYSSPISKSALKKYPVYMKDIMPTFQQEMMKSMEKAAPGMRGGPGQHGQPDQQPR